jgi:hypothetical protein
MPRPFTARPGKTPSHVGPALLASASEAIDALERIGHAREKKRLADRLIGEPFSFPG